MFGLLISVPSVIYPNDCDISARCKHPIVELVQSLGFGLIFIGPVLMLFGALGSIMLGAVLGIRSFKAKDSDRPLYKWIKRFIGIACSGALIYLAYIPGGPDPCSRVITDTQYEKCLENIFANMSLDDARQWLEEHGYDVTSNLRGDWSGEPGLGIEDGKVTFRYDRFFTAYRNHGPTKSVPYGTNFNRIFARIGPAPDHFELNVYGWETEDHIERVRVWWAFSFL
jgi:hypothetical protein